MPKFHYKAKRGPHEVIEGDMMAENSDQVVIKLDQMDLSPVSITEEGNTAEQVQKRILKDIVERAFDGSAMNLMAALLGTDIVSRKDLGKARQLIEQREKGRKR